MLGKHVNTCKFLVNLSFLELYYAEIDFDPDDSVGESGSLCKESCCRSDETRDGNEGRGVGRGSLISIYLNEHWHKLQHPLSAVKIK